MSDKRSNRCAKCNHTYTSRWHQTRCMGRHGAEIKRRSRAGGHITRRSAGDVLTFGSFHGAPPVNASFYDDRKPVTPEVQA